MNPLRQVPRIARISGRSAESRHSQLQVMTDVTHILEAIQRGESQSAEQLLPLVYAELRRLAAHKMASENPGHTLQPTALVHEAWLKLGGEQNRQWRNRNHFFATAAEAMR